MIEVGDRVRVKESVTVYHHPEYRNQPFELKGLEGEVVAVLNDWKGRVISPNLPIEVKFSKKFKAHFQPQELERLES